MVHRKRRTLTSAGDVCSIPRRQVVSIKFLQVSIRIQEISVGDDTELRCSFPLWSVLYSRLTGSNAAGFSIVSFCIKRM